MKTAVNPCAPRNRPSRPAWALLLLALFLTLQVFASSSALHHAIHADADSPDHHCAITLLAQGQTHAPLALGIWLNFTLALLFFLPLLAATVPSSLDLRLAPSRAPPRF